MDAKQRRSEDTFEALLQHIVLLADGTEYTQTTLTSPESPMRILLIDDDRGHIESFKELLRESGEVFEITNARTLMEGIRMLGEEKYDAVALDITLPDSKGAKSFANIFRWHPDVPVVIVSAVDDDKLAYSLIVAGAQDYLVKGQFDRKTAVKAVKYAVARNAFSKCNAELKNLKQELQSANLQLSGIANQYTELITLIGEVKDGLTPSRQYAQLTQR